MSPVYDEPNMTDPAGAVSVDWTWREMLDRTASEAEKAAEFHRMELSRHEAVLRSAQAAMRALEDGPPAQQNHLPDA